MLWSRVKSILIILFLAIDIILLSSIIMTSYTVTTIEDSIITDTVSILERNNIKIDKTTVPKTIKSMGVVELKNAWTDNEKAAAALMGGAPVLEGGAYVLGNKKTQFGENMFFFSDSAPAEVPYSKSAYKTAFADMGIYAQEDFINLSGSGAVTLCQSVDDFRIFETYVEAQLLPAGGISSANGYCILFGENGISKKPSSQLTAVTSVLINLLQNPYLPEGGMEITAIETGYSLGNIYRDTLHKVVSVIPAYKISASDGSYYMYDAMTGDFLYANINNEILAS